LLKKPITESRKTTFIRDDYFDGRATQLAQKQRLNRIQPFGTGDVKRINRAGNEDEKTTEGKT